MLCKSMILTWELVVSSVLPQVGELLLTLVVFFESLLLKKVHVAANAMWLLFRFQFIFMDIVGLVKCFLNVGNHSLECMFWHKRFSFSEKNLIFIYRKYLENFSVFLFTENIMKIKDHILCMLYIIVEMKYFNK